MGPLGQGHRLVGSTSTRATWYTGLWARGITPFRYCAPALTEAWGPAIGVIFSKSEQTRRPAWVVTRGRDLRRPSGLFSPGLHKSIHVFSLASPSWREPWEIWGWGKLPPTMRAHRPPTGSSRFTDIRARGMVWGRSHPWRGNPPVSPLIAHRSTFSVAMNSPRAMGSTAITTISGRMVSIWFCVSISSVCTD
jgi:hypothetical protein